MGDVNEQLLALVKSFGHKVGCAKNAFGEQCSCGVDEAITAAEQAQQAEPSQEWFNCLIEDISAIDCMYRGDPTYEHDAYWMKDRVIKMLEKRRDATQQQAEPVAAQRRFEGEEWSPCTLAHHLLVQAHPKEWPHYETRALYAQPPAVAVPDGYALVPIDPTEEMFIDGMEADCLGRPSIDDETHVRGIWRAMITAAQKGGA